MADDRSKFAGSSSLYAGIFSKDKTALVPSTTSSSIAPSVAAPDAPQVPSKTSSDAAEPTSDAVAAPSTTGAADQTSKPAWSAALRFAPRKTTQQKKQAARPSTGLSATFASVPVQDASPVTARSGSGFKSVTKVPIGVGNIHEQAQPSKLPPLSVSSRAPDFFTTPSKIVAPSDRNFSPPPLTLPPEQIASDKELARLAAEARGEGKVKNNDEAEIDDDGEGDEDDVNGFSKTKMGQRAKRKRNRRKRSPMRGASQTVNMDADYDPRIPNDYAAYTTMVAERRRAIRQRQREENDDWDEGSDDYSEDERLNEEQKRKLSRFAPPPNLYGNASTVPPPSAETLEDLDALVPDESPPPEEPIPLPAQAQAPPPPPPPPSAPPSESPLPPPRTGEEAYARRLAMSANLMAQQQDFRARGPAPTGPPGLPPSGPAVSPPPPDTSAAVAAAAAIAARLSAAAPKETASKRFSAPTFVAGGSFLSPPAGSEEPDGEGGMMSRAKRQMEGWGYKEGEGLGSEGNKGIVNPLTASRTEPAGGSSSSDARHSQKGKPWGAQASGPARGSIVNDNKDEREAEERRRFGQPSKTVLLEDMVHANDVDDELRDEIGSECAKHGVLSDVHIEVHTPAGVRIFVRFSGMVGAWKTVRELDGRFFAGRTVRARYYPDEWWDDGMWLGFL